MQLGLNTTFSFEGLAPQDTLAAAKEIEIVIGDAKAEGDFTPAICKRLAQLGHQITGLNYEVKSAPWPNAIAAPGTSFNTGGSDQVTVSGSRAKKMIELVQTTIKTNPNAVTTLQTKNYHYNPKTFKFEDTSKDSFFYLFIGKPLLQELTPTELTAIVLHEIGHTWYETRQSLMFIEQSVVLQETMNHVLNDDKKESVEFKSYILANLDKKGQRELWNKIDKNKAKPKDYMIASLCIAGKKLNSTSYGAYKGQRHEQSADYFAVSCGYALPLYSGLDRLKGLNPMLPFGLTNTFLGALMIASFINLTVASMSAIFLAILALGSFADAKINPYDRPYMRAQKILVNLRGNLKNLEGVPQEIIKEQLAQLDALEAKLASKKDMMLICDVMNVFFLRDRWGRKNEEALESLLNNPLYVSALRFRLQE